MLPSLQENDDLAVTAAAVGDAESIAKILAAINSALKDMKDTVYMIETDETGRHVKKEGGRKGNEEGEGGEGEEEVEDVHIERESDMGHDDGDVGDDNRAGGSADTSSSLLPQNDSFASFPPLSSLPPGTPFHASLSRALAAASVMGQTIVVKQLVGLGGDACQHAMLLASAAGQAESLEILLENCFVQGDDDDDDDGGRPSARRNANTVHSFAGSSLLHFAAETGQSHIITLLCEKGANVEMEKLNHGARPLHIAVDQNQPDAVRALIAPPCSASINESLMFGDTSPLYLAAQYGHVEVAKILIERGANVDFIMPETGVASTALAGVINRENKQEETGKKKQNGEGPGGGEKEERNHRGEEDDQGSRRGCERKEDVTIFEEETPAQLDEYHNKGSSPFSQSFELGNGATPLHVAVENGHWEMVKVLGRC